MEEGPDAAIVKGGETRDDSSCQSYQLAVGAMASSTNIDNAAELERFMTNCCASGVSKRADGAQYQVQANVLTSTTDSVETEVYSLRSESSKRLLLESLHRGVITFSVLPLELRTSS